MCLRISARCLRVLVETLPSSNTTVRPELRHQWMDHFDADLKQLYSLAGTSCQRRKKHILEAASAPRAWGVLPQRVPLR